MANPKNRAIQLDYGRDKPKVPPRFRLGIISVSIAILGAITAMSSMAMKMSPGIMNLLASAGGVLSLVGAGTGIAGLFQRGSRTVAIVGTLISIAELMLLPAMMVA